MAGDPVHSALLPALTSEGDPAPSLIRVDGLWIHRGVPDKAFDWDRVIEDIREERTQILGDAFPPTDDKPV